MKTQLIACFFALFAAAVLAQDQILRDDLLRTYGTGVVLVPIDRAAITITAAGNAPLAADAVQQARDLQSSINDTLRDFTIHDVRSGGLSLMPIYTGSVLSFSARQSLTIVVPANETAQIIDEMVNLGAANITFMFTPDFFAVELAQKQSLQLAVVDALYKAQAVLNTIRHCASNITRVDIRNPVVELPALAFGLFANMGGLRQINNLLDLNRETVGSPTGAPEESADQEQQQFDESHRREAFPVMMLGAGAPFLEGDREQIVSYVELWLNHAACGEEGATDITSALDLSNIVGIAGGTFEARPESPIESPIESPLEGTENTEGMSQRRRMW